MAINNSTISAEISGSSIVVDIAVRLSSANSNTRFKQDGYGYLMRSVNGGSYSKISSDYTLIPVSNDAIYISEDITYTDNSVSNQNTYRYYFEMIVNEETAPPQERPL